MSLNSAEINLILKELDIEGSYVQKIVQPSYSALVLFLYKNRAINLFIGLEGGACRLHETAKKIPKFEKPLRFMELLRSKIRGMKITQAEQLHNDRIIKISLSGGDEKLFLYIRLWSGAANIILTDSQQRIIDAFYRRPKRGEVSGALWNEPEPPQTASVFSVREYDSTKSFNQAIEEWYDQKAPKVSREALLEQAENLYGARIDKLRAVIKKLTAKRQTFSQNEQLKHQGDLLLSNLHLIKPNSDFVELEDYTAPGTVLRIQLNPQKTAKENAAFYYEQYKKAVSGLQALSEDIQAAENRIAGLQAELANIRAEENPRLIEKLLRKQPAATKQKPATQKEKTGVTFFVDDWTLHVGRTAAENDSLLRHVVKGADLWLHTRDYAGGYVFIKAKKNKTVPLPVLIAAGNLAVFYSKARKAGAADLYYTQVKHLRRAKNAPKGTVLPSNEKNLSVKLDPEILKMLESCRAD
ncbi:NFACT RNA binding domain-containing protein [Treponema phagedenis]|uniref:NFACT RNA binding domain-containing protein n=1 Tax=Treponema phagedenis TaxID=162 RepID=UPI0001F63F55|nr:NFACT family protein [Treponema phagedenis]EFW37432.1 fibronectin-binding protein A domain protein [Treponema phagedenis F0421]NVP24728.1 fibronectin-binding domain-containing protein [Treponema phagedenis]QKS93037.1 fibronectin-binding domain-containing protein [Treponema phagedenis]QLC58917.1 fibronectin-binding domain-containing protein [Treponema phagedenis]TYT78247.1 fibronectin-binding domain-containing protein [Treponema phagedenis]